MIISLLSLAGLHLDKRDLELYIGVAIFTALLVERGACRLHTTTCKHNSILKKRERRI